jgi:hypothetical protein
VAPLPIFALRWAGRGVDEMLKIISLGWGVQSFTLAAMSALGKLEPVDFAIHADTTHESQLTYEFSARWTGWLNERGVRVITIKPKEADPIKNKGGFSDVPYYSASVSHGNGQTKRQCTTNWKIIPIRQVISLLVQQLGETKKPGIVEQWIGISMDEWKRMKDNDVQYIKNRWPLIEKKMTRTDCVIWLEKNGLEIPPRSACIFCPFHNTDEWRRIKANDTDWNNAVLVDRAIRKNSPGYAGYEQFVHPSRKPLEDVDLRTEQEKGQLSLWDQECSGICGI